IGLAARRGRFFERRRAALATSPPLRGLAWLLVCVNAGVLFLAAAFTKPAAKWGYCWQTGNELDHEIQALIHEHLLPLALGFPWGVLAASVLVSVGIYVFAEQYFVARSGQPQRQGPGS